MTDNFGIHMVPLTIGGVTVEVEDRKVKPSIRLFSLAEAVRNDLGWPYSDIDKEGMHSFGVIIKPKRKVVSIEFRRSPHHGIWGIHIAGEVIDARFAPLYDRDISLYGSFPDDVDFQTVIDYCKNVLIPKLRIAYVQHKQRRAEFLEKKRRLRNTMVEVPEDVISKLRNKMYHEVIAGPLGLEERKVVANDFLVRLVELWEENNGKIPGTYAKAIGIQVQ